MAEDSILDRRKVSTLLNPALQYVTISTLLNPALQYVSTTEEQRRPWCTRPFERFETPFLRIWDQYSGSQPDGENTMMSRAPRQRLDSFEARKTSLTTHINHKDWTPTPYISFTTSAAAIEELVDMRDGGGGRRKRGDQSLTVVDPMIRVRDGLPILDIGAEMDHYKIQDPYGKSMQYYEDHYFCLWQVTKEQIVGHWKWSDLDGHRNWYHDIIMPAFWQFRESNTVRVLQKQNPFDLTAMKDVLHYTNDRSNRPTNLCSGIPINYHEDEDGWGTSSEGGVFCYGDEEGSDTDDEVEEANAADDFLNAL